MKAWLSRIRSAVGAGLRKGFSGYVWMLKILVPVSLATALLDYSGWIHKLDSVLKPAMALLSLPPTAALPLLLGVLTGPYGCIAAMTVLPLSVNHMTIIAVFVLIAHNLPQEGIIQANSGINFVKTTLIRLAAAIVTSMIVAWCLQPDNSGVAATASSDLRTVLSFRTLFQNWALEMFALCVKILLIIVAVMILIELMKEFNLIDVFVRILAPALKMMGLNRQAGLLWLTGVLFGLTYGGAVIVEQSRELRLSPAEIEKLQLSIGINHSMIEDPLLFLPLGVNPFWVWVPRLVAAIAAVYVACAWFRLRKSFGLQKTTTT